MSWRFQNSNNSTISCTLNDASLLNFPLFYNCYSKLIYVLVWIPLLRTQRHNNCNWRLHHNIIITPISSFSAWLGFERHILDGLQGEITLHVLGSTSTRIEPSAALERFKKRPMFSSACAVASILSALSSPTCKYLLAQSPKKVGKASTSWLKVQRCLTLSCKQAGSVMTIHTYIYICYM